MKNRISKLIAIVLVLAVTVGTIPAIAFATGTDSSSTESDGYGSETLGEKTAKAIRDAAGEYEVKVQVPGGSDAEQYAEIIIMADASNSIKNYWDNFQRMVNALGERVLDENTTLKLTLMGYGIGPKHAGTFNTMSELKAFMNGATTDDFMQERSATNCEVGFEFVEEYINNSSNLKETYVIYLSDAAANMTEKKFDISGWSEKYNSANMSYLVNSEVYNILEGSKPLEVTEELFPTVCDDLIELREKYAQDPNSVSEEINIAMKTMLDSSKSYGEQIVNDVFAMSGLSADGEYTASEMEKIFQTYFRATVGKKNPLYDNFMDFFYVCFLIPMNRDMPDDHLRAAQASLSLQNNEKVLELYHVCYNKYSNNWMNPDYAKSEYAIEYSDKVTYLYGANFGEAITEVENNIEKLVTTIYKDVTVTDPMSEWVILEPSSIAIYFGENKIYQYGEGEGTGWLIDNPPVTDEDGNPKNPIVLEKNDDGRYEITWHVKTGNLLITDNFSLRYKVRLNEDAEGFVPGTDYPLNDPTTASYIDEDGIKQTKNIPVPEGKAYVVDYEYVSGTPGVELPENFVPVPVDGNIYNDDSTVNAKDPEKLKFDDPKNGGYWTFESWDANSKQINGENITFVGKWVFTAYSKDVPNKTDTGDENNVTVYLLSMLLAVAVGGRMMIRRSN